MFRSIAAKRFLSKLHFFSVNFVKLYKYSDKGIIMFNGTLRLLTSKSTLRLGYCLHLATIT